MEKSALQPLGFCGDNDSRTLLENKRKTWTERSQRIRLTNAKDDFVDVHCGEVEEEEGEVKSEEWEAQNHTDPLLQPLSYGDNKHIKAH